MSLPDAPPTDAPISGKPDEVASPKLPAGVLPPVEAPTGTFILQLFLIPLLIVTIVVVVWLLFSWLAHMGRDNPTKIADSLMKGDAWSGQRAYELADLLRSPDPKYDALRNDSQLAKRLGDYLSGDLKQPAEGQGDWRVVMRRMYLCRALGSFEVSDGLPALLEAAKLERDPVEVEIRYAAIEGIASLAYNCGPESLADDADVMQTLLEASRAVDDASAPAPSVRPDGTPTLYRPHAELRAVAAYALGVVGGEESRERLKRMLHDAYPNARYNAATGLARHGDIAAEPVLREMLDPANTQAGQDEKNPNDQARKRSAVLLNGIKATLRLAETNPSADLTRLKASLSTLADSPLDDIQIDRSKLKSAAREALRMLEG